MKKFIYGLLVLGVIVSTPSFVLAEETNEVTEVDIVVETVEGAPLAELFVSGEEVVSEEADQDENVTAEDLGIEEPVLLPTSNLYFAKNLWRGINTFFTFNPIKKAEKQLQHADEKLLEAKKMAEETGNEEALVRAMEKYEKVSAKASERIEKAKAKYQEDPDFQKVVDKFVKNKFLHEKLINKIEERLENASDEAKERFTEAREQAMARFSETLNIVDGDKMAERIEKATNAISGSKLKQLKNLEVLKRIEEKLPEQALPVIKRAQENALKRFEEKLGELNQEEQKEKLGNYLGKIKGNSVRHLEILEDLKRTEGVSQKILNTIDAVKKRPLERINKKLESLETSEKKEEYLKHLKEAKTDKLEIFKELEKGLEVKNIEVLQRVRQRLQEKLPEKVNAPEAIQRIIDRKEGEARICAQVITSARSIKTKECKTFSSSCLPADWVQDNTCVKTDIGVAVCTIEYEPVCGSNGKTYFNPCKAKIAKIEIKHRGVCTSVSVKECPLVSLFSPEIKEKCRKEEGKIVPNKDSKGCILSYKCVVPVSSVAD